LEQTYEGQGAEITALAFSPDGKTLGSVSLDGTVILWNTDG
jgi:WD40 repeat protein